jgi:hypothetical protein
VGKPEIPNLKYQIPNHSQHAAQAPALRVTKIKNLKRTYDIEKMNISTLF